MICCPGMECVHGHVTSLNFCKWIDNISETLQERSIQRKTNTKLYVAYRMTPTAMTLSDLEGHFCCLNYLPDLGNRKTYVACNFNCRLKTEGLLKVTGSHHTL